MDKQSDNNYWNDLKYKIKQNYPQLTTADLTLRNGTKKDELIGQIANTLVMSKKELQEIIAAL